MGPGSYCVLPEPELTSELSRLAAAKKIGDVSCVSLQPCPNPDFANQDRYVIREWALPGGTWNFTAVFDGHGGEETVDHVAKVLPSIIKERLSAAISTADCELPSNTVSNILSHSISSVDISLTQDLSDLFPGGPEAIGRLSDEAIRNVINDRATGGSNNAKVLRCMRGSTVLVSLIDPMAQNLWVASLGDCQAVLGIQSPSGQWEATILSSNHNGNDDSEKARIHSEHPDEPECILRDRVLGAIAVTRAIGDQVFKLPSIYTKRVFENCSPGFQLSTPIDVFLGRNKTPPYLSNEADIQHVDLRNIDARFLIMCSDGLVDLYVYDQERTGSLQAIANKWVELVGRAMAQNPSDNSALSLLRDALGGDDEERVSQMLTVEEVSKWMDDTTVLVQSL
ncbi:protein serine threonine phosphatase 2C [Hygrophoropsis aurantiaca]|uniref:Protein serine threonine phosphatase 2C n=1 Tax=Hygrophoropsis aurantiaca TaxID=72124 RepID=A0ACB7ZXM6_9AGAM|nr:protein serine threonine phosphatase 2C [Hygrophoropsis aurantiaca]